GLGLTAINWAAALFYNGLGRYADALAAAQKATEHPRDIAPVLPEVIEGGARSGNPEDAADALERLSETTRTSGSDWGLGIEARSRALVSEGEAGGRLHHEAIEPL